MASLKNIHRSKNLDFYALSTEVEVSIPYSGALINAGFPSPAEDFMEGAIDLNKSLIQNPDTTFCARARGESMKDIGIFSGDLLIIDKSLEPAHNKIAVCFIDGEFTVKRIKVSQGVVWLVAENPAFTPIKVTEENQFIVWGIVVHVIKSF